jgi:small subunit ribosomal protein S6
MRKYELVCIIHPDMDEAAFNGVVEKIKDWITESGGSIDRVEVWGRKHLSYVIKKQHEGQYVLFNIGLLPATTTTLDQNLRFLEPVIRYMLTSVD